MVTTQAVAANGPPNYYRREARGVGIIAAEVYIPKLWVKQSELEEWCKVPSGKYTEGLGQLGMSVPRACEDVVSMCLTVVRNLLDKRGIDAKDVGRLEVGSESGFDRSKSIKSYLMQLFPDKRGTPGGVDNVNACYGGTAALFNSICWMESGDWDGRFAVVVAGDVAIYSHGPARPTGGAGAIALLIGPDAPIRIERGTVSHWMEHVYDFYKPDPNSEYPLVDGPASIECYMRSLKECYSNHCDKIVAMSRRGSKAADGEEFVPKFDYFVFHAPYGKLVKKAVESLQAGGWRSGVDSVRSDCSSRAAEEGAGENAKLAAGIVDQFETHLTRLLPSEMGNCYCASLYLGLVSLLCQLEGRGCVGKRIGMFSYGSGLAASMFSLIIESDPTEAVPSVGDLRMRLGRRRKVTPHEFEQMLAERATLFSRADWLPAADDDMAEEDAGIYYLQRVDEKFRRFYRLVK